MKNFILYIEGDQGLLTLISLLKFTKNIIVVIPELYDCKDIEETSHENKLNLFVKKKKKILDLSKYKPNIIISSQFPYKLSEKEYSIAKDFAVNIHASELPLYRGKNSDVWALLNDERKIGITIHKLDQDFDSGEILDIKYVNIDDSLNLNEIYKKVSSKIPEIIEEIYTENILISKDLEKKDNIYWRARTLSDSKIEWRMSARYVFLHIRALSRDPIFAYSFSNNKKFTFLEVEVTDMLFLRIPGTVLFIKNVPHIVCGDNILIKVIKYKSEHTLKDKEILH